jgi:preprotein translocase subunit YajC
MSQIFAFIALQDAGQSGSALLGYLPILLIFAVFYFLLIRPQARERKRVEQETQEFRSSLKNGDRVITSGGLYGTITAVREDTVQLRVADAVKIEVLRSAVVSRQPDAGQSAPETK